MTTRTRCINLQEERITYSVVCAYSARVPVHVTTRQEKRKRNNIQRTTNVRIYTSGHARARARTSLKRVRFGRGVGLRFVRRLDEWRPGKEGRQEVIKVKVFEGQSVSFRGVAIVGRDRPHPGADNHGRYRGNRGRQTTKSGTVIVATITPDKLVRFWTSGGDLLGSLDQVGICASVTFVYPCMCSESRLLTQSRPETSNLGRVLSFPSLSLSLLLSLPLSPPFLVTRFFSTHHTLLIFFGIDRRLGLDRR